MSIATITPQELSQRQAQDASIRILDVRSPAEFSSLRATTADNVPLDRLDPNAYVQQTGNNGAPIYIICKMGGRSMKACQQFVAQGIPNVVNVEGGTDGWAAAGLPVHRSQSRTMPLDCQVRVFAGSLVALGAALSFVHPLWVLLSAFIGCGLVYSGLTNTCGMASMLARMPWNQDSATSSSAATKISDPQAAQCDTGG